MKTIKLIFLVTVLILFNACSDDDQTNTLVLEDKIINLNENPTSDLLTEMVATDSNENNTLTYSIESQTPSNSVTINSANGEIYVNNPDAFDYEQNTQVKVEVLVSNGETTTVATLTINILDVNENG